MAADFLSRFGMTFVSSEDRKASGDIVYSVNASTHRYLEVLEPHLTDTYRFLDTTALLEEDSEKRLRLKQNAKGFLAWSGRLFCRTQKRLRRIPSQQVRVDILRVC